MPAQPPLFAEFNRIEEGLLTAKLDAARKAIAHAGDKGRALEHEVRTLLRSFLPMEYGLSTGFVVFHTQSGLRLSSQIDIVIYDAVRSGPIVRLETCDVFPLEAVYGYVEVKATLQSSSDDADEWAENSVERCLKNNRELRAMKERRFWAPLSGSRIETGLFTHEWMGLRSYVFAFEPVGAVAKDLSQLAQRMANISKRLGQPAHLHGLIVANHGFFYTRPVDTRHATEADYYHVKYSADHPLSSFKTFLLHGLTTFPRPQLGWTPGIDQYYENEPKWDIRAPEA